MNSISRYVNYTGITAIALTMLAAVTLLAGIAIPAQAQTESVLYSFQGSPSGSGPDGSWPYAGPTLQGTTLYGTTVGGGSAGNGTAWAVSTTAGKETILYSFQGGLSDGQNPYGGLAYYKGSLYGTTSAGPSGYGGTIFKLTKKGKKYVETILYTFSAGAAPDGSQPGYVTPVFDKEGNLYGTTSGGGAYSGGVVFKLSPGGEITVLHSFNPDYPNSYDGFDPIGGVSIDKKGNIYGVTNGAVPMTGARCTKSPPPETTARSSASTETMDTTPTLPRCSIRKEISGAPRRMVWASTATCTSST